MAFTKRKRRGLIISVALILLVVLTFWWLFGWGGGNINIMDFEADDVASMKLGATISGYDVFCPTDKEDIQTVIDEVNGFQHAGKAVRQYMEYGFNSGGAILYEFGIELTDGQELYYCFATRDGIAPGEDIEGSYWGTIPKEGNMWRGSMDWFHALYEKYSR